MRAPCYGTVRSMRSVINSGLYPGISETGRMVLFHCTGGFPKPALGVKAVARMVLDLPGYLDGSMKVQHKAISSRLAAHDVQSKACCGTAGAENGGLTGQPGAPPCNEKLCMSPEHTVAKQEVYRVSTVTANGTPVAPLISALV